MTRRTKYSICLGGPDGERCPELVPRPDPHRQGRCERHRLEVQASKDRLYERLGRDIYQSPRWRGLRRTILRREPWCRTSGCNTLATDIDHIVPIREGIDDPYDESNLQPLCKKHHSEKTAREVWGRKVGT